MECGFCNGLFVENLLVLGVVLFFDLLGGFFGVARGRPFLVDLLEDFVLLLDKLLDFGNLIS